MDHRQLASASDRKRKDALLGKKRRAEKRAIRVKKDRFNFDTASALQNFVGKQTYSKKTIATAEDIGQANQRKFMSELGTREEAYSASLQRELDATLYAGVQLSLSQASSQTSYMDAVETAHCAALLEQAERASQALAAAEASMVSDQKRKLATVMNAITDASNELATARQEQEDALARGDADAYKKASQKIKDARDAFENAAAEATAMGSAVAKTVVDAAEDIDRKIKEAGEKMRENLRKAQRAIEDMNRLLEDALRGLYMDFEFLNQMPHREVYFCLQHICYCYPRGTSPGTCSPLECYDFKTMKKGMIETADFCHENSPMTSDFGKDSNVPMGIATIQQRAMTNRTLAGLGFLKPFKMPSFLLHEYLFGSDGKTPNAIVGGSLIMRDSNRWAASGEATRTIVSPRKNCFDWKVKLYNRAPLTTDSFTFMKNLIDQIFNILFKYRVNPLKVSKSLTVGKRNEIEGILIRTEEALETLVNQVDGIASWDTMSGSPGILARLHEQLDVIQTCVPLAEEMNAYAAELIRKDTLIPKSVANIKFKTGAATLKRKTMEFYGRFHAMILKFEDDVSIRDKPTLKQELNRYKYEVGTFIRHIQTDLHQDLDDACEPKVPTMACPIYADPARPVDKTRCSIGCCFSDNTHACMYPRGIEGLKLAEYHMRTESIVPYTEDQIQTEFGRLLFVAIESNQIENAKWLIDKQAKLDMDVTGDGWMALHYSILKERQDISKYLIEKGADCTIPIQFSIEMVEKKKGKKTPKPILDEEVTPLILASRYGLLSLVKLLLPKSDKNATTGNGVSALSIACTYAHEDVVRFLLEADVDVENGQDSNENSPLLIATRNLLEDIAIRLIDKGANVNAMNKDMMTAFSIGGGEMMVKSMPNLYLTLLGKEAQDVVEFNEENQGALDAARKRRDQLREAENAKDEARKDALRSSVGGLTTGFPDVGTLRGSELSSADLPPVRVGTASTQSEGSRVSVSSSSPSMPESASESALPSTASSASTVEPATFANLESTLQLLETKVQEKVDTYCVELPQPEKPKPRLYGPDDVQYTTETTGLYENYTMDILEAVSLLKSDVETTPIAIDILSSWNSLESVRLLSTSEPVELAVRGELVSLMECLFDVAYTKHKNTPGIDASHWFTTWKDVSDGKVTMTEDHIPLLYTIFKTTPLTELADIDIQYFYRTIRLLLAWLTGTESVDPTIWEKGSLDYRMLADAYSGYIGNGAV